MLSSYSFLDVLRRGERKRTEVDEVRQLILNRVTVPIAAFGAIAILLGAWRAVLDGDWVHASVYIGAYSLFLILGVLMRQLSVNFRGAILIAALLVVGTASLARVGLAGVGPLIYIIVCGLASVFWGLRRGVEVTVVCVILMAIGGYYHGWGSADQVTLLSWVISGVVVGVASLSLLFPFQALRIRLEEALDESTDHVAELERANAELRSQNALREQAEAALKDSEQRYRNIFEMAAVSIWEVDLSEVYHAIDELDLRQPERLRAHLASHPEVLRELVKKARIMDVNEMTLTLYGAESKEELFEAYAEGRLFDLEERTADLLDAALSGNTVFEMEAINRTVHGEPINILLRAAIPRSGSQENVLISIMDLSKSKRLEHELLEARKMEAVGTFAGGIAHDFNNLLMGLRGCVSLLRTSVPSEAENVQTMEQIIESGAELTHQLLGMARREPNVPVPLDLNKLVERSLKVFGRVRKDIGIKLELEKDLPPVEADSGQIEQVILNICVNAGQAMPDGGRLSITTKSRTDGPLLESGRVVHLAINDTGVGMDTNTQELIFEPYFTTKEKGRGTGLGLAAALGIIKSHRGYITVDSEPDVGTTFDIYLPATDKALPVEPEKKGKPVRGTETVLVVDDESMVLKVGARMLQRLGYEVIRASGGSAAVDEFEEHKDTIALVVLDLVMPEMSGGEVFDRLQQIQPGVPVLLSSGFSRNRLAEEILNRGARGFIQKPFDLVELSEAIREILD